MTETRTQMTLAELAEACYENSAAHGFWDNEETVETIPNKLMLIVSEVAEALESYRDPESDTLVKVPSDLVARLCRGDSSSREYYGARRELSVLYEKWLAKPKGFDIEIADAFIRLFDLAGRKGIDIEAAILRKHEYNKSRPRMHGRLV